MARRSIKAGVVGYGRNKIHVELITMTKGLELVAICDRDESRLEAAKKDYPGVGTFNDIELMLKDPGIDLVTIVTPHNTHAELALRALRAGKNVIVDKPMCITVEEADAMIAEANRRGLMLTVFHNRRLDGDFMAIKDVVDRGLIGKLFQVEFFAGGYNHPGHWWRSDKRVSGGAIYDGGAHILDWVLNIMREEIVGVNGYSHKLVWNDVTNEDQAQATMIFKSGAVADVQVSSIAAVGKPRWRILGSTGGILDHEVGDKFKLYAYSQGYMFETAVPYKMGEPFYFGPRYHWNLYYKNIVEHMLEGKGLLVTPESARRVVAVMRTAEKSWISGKTEKMPTEP
jgi:predicted dehydrogenase